MKNLLFMVLLFASTYVYSQEAKIEAPTSNFEIGIAKNLKCTFTNTSSSYTVIESYKWEALYNGPNAGQVGGKINNENVENLTINSTDFDNSASIVYGDFFSNATVSIKCTVTFRDSIGKALRTKESKVLETSINNICNPSFDKSSIQSCCTAPFSLSATACYGNNFTWTVTGGTFTGQGNKTITITPTITGNISVSCVARRNESVTAYNRSNNITITRTTPETSPIIYNKTTICKMMPNAFSIAPKCGLIGVTWSAPNCTITGQGTLTASISPNSNVATGSFISVSATPIYNGGCTVASTSKTNLRVIDGSIPPMPSIFQLTKTYPNGYTYNNGVYPIINFSYPQYSNGFTTLSQTSTFMDLCPYDLQLTVCNVNACTNVSTCKTFTINIPSYALPINNTPCCNASLSCYDEQYCQLLQKQGIDPNSSDPCGNNLPRTIFNQDSSSIIKNSFTFVSNITDNKIIFNSGSTKDFDLKLLDMNGAILYQQEIKDTEGFHEISLNQELATGIYMIHIHHGNIMFTEKLTKK